MHNGYLFARFVLGRLGDRCLGRCGRQFTLVTFLLLLFLLFLLVVLSAVQLLTDALGYQRVDFLRSKLPLLVAAHSKNKFLESDGGKYLRLFHAGVLHFVVRAVRLRDILRGGLLEWRRLYGDQSSHEYISKQTYQNGDKIR
jgi:hypothetical protein